MDDTVYFLNSNIKHISKILGINTGMEIFNNIYQRIKTFAALLSILSFANRSKVFRLIL